MKQVKEKVTDAVEIVPDPPLVPPMPQVHEVKDTPSQYGQAHRFNCLHKLAPNEPFFVLRAQDLLAPHQVEQWAMNAEKSGCDPAKVLEARRTALDMMSWRGRKYPD